MQKRIKLIIEYDAGVVDLDEEDLEEEQENRAEIIEQWKQYLTEESQAILDLVITDIKYEDA